MSDASRSHEAPSELRRRRDELAEQVAKLQWDLGGLTYEMAIRDHFRVDVLVQRAAMLQERDAELGEVERLLRMEESAVAGSCANCGAVRSRGAVFCWQCGAQVMEHSAGVLSNAAETGEGDSMGAEAGATVKADAKITEADTTREADSKVVQAETRTVEADAKIVQAKARISEANAKTVEIDAAPLASNGSLGRPAQSGS